MREVRATLAPGGGALPLLAIGYGLIFWLCYLGYAVYLGVLANDFGVFDRAAGESLETVYSLRARNPFAYPPTTLLWLQPLRAVDFGVGFALWTLLSAGAVGWACTRVAPRRVALLVLISPAMATCAAMGQFGAIVGAMILFASSVKGWRQGLLLGLAATLKPQILLAAPLLLLVRRDWESIAAAAAAAIAVVALQAALLGPHLWIDWLAALRAFPEAVERAGAYAGSVGPPGVAAHFGLPGWPFLLIGMALAALLLHKRGRAAEGSEFAALLIIAGGLISPYMLVYDLVGAMPFAIERMLARADRARVPASALFLAPFAGLALLWLVVVLIGSKMRRQGSEDAALASA